MEDTSDMFEDEIVQQLNQDSEIDESDEDSGEDKNIVVSIDTM